jgi:hypothetical protein
MLSFADCGTVSQTMLKYILDNVREEMEMMQILTGMNRYGTRLVYSSQASPYFS